MRWLGSVDVLLSWDAISPYSGAHAEWITLHSPRRNPPAHSGDKWLCTPRLGIVEHRRLRLFTQIKQKQNLGFVHLEFFSGTVLCIFSRQLWWLLSTLLRGVYVGSMWFSFESVLTLSLYTLIV